MLPAPVKAPPLFLIPFPCEPFNVGRTEFSPFLQLLNGHPNPAIPLLPLKVKELELELALALDEAKLDDDDFEKLPEYPPLGILSGRAGIPPNAPAAAFASAKKNILTL